MASLNPEEDFKLGAESYIEIPGKDEEFHAPDGVVLNLQEPYEILPELDT